MIAPANPPGTARRERLARLRAEPEPLVAAERRAALRLLLQHPLLTPDGPRADSFALVRRHREYAADWFAHHAGWSLTVSAEAIRLRKFPAGHSDATRGAIEPRSGEPFNRTRYALFCLALAEIERGDRQTTLDRLARALAELVATRLVALRLAERRSEGLHPLPAIGRFALRPTGDTAPADTASLSFDL